MCLECVWRILNVSGMCLENFEYVLTLECVQSVLNVSGAF